MRTSHVKTQLLCCYFCHKKEYLHQHLNFQQEKVFFYFHRWENICKTHGFLCTILSERQKHKKKLLVAVQN